MNGFLIDLRDLRDKFSTSGRQICADCGRDFDRDDDRAVDRGPLLLWRNDGKEMLTLCGTCAGKRLKSTPVCRTASGRNCYPLPQDNPRCHCSSPGNRFLCGCGHLTECHWPQSCKEANCSHMDRYEQ